MVVRVADRPEQIPAAEALGEFLWLWFEVHQGAALAAVCGIGLGEDGNALLILKPLALTPKRFRGFLREDMPWLKAYCREHGAVRIVSTAGAADTGFYKLTKAAGYVEYVQLAVINLEG